MSHFRLNHVSLFIREEPAPTALMRLTEGPLDTKNLLRGFHAECNCGQCQHRADTGVIPFFKWQGDYQRNDRKEGGAEGSLEYKCGQENQDSWIPFAPLAALAFSH